MKKRIVAIVLITFLSVTVFGLLSPAVTRTYAEQTWQRVDFISGIVTAYELNVRKGPSTKYSIVGTLKQNQWVNVLAKIGDWYVIYEPNTGLVGCCSGKYLQPPNKVEQPPGSNPKTCLLYTSRCV